MAGTVKVAYGTTIIVIAVILSCVTMSCGQSGHEGQEPHQPAVKPYTGGWLRGINVRHERFRMKDGSLEAVLSAAEMDLDDDGNLSMSNASLEASTTDGLFRTRLRRY